MTGVRFTRPDGMARIINPDMVADVSPAPSGFAKEAKTLIVEESGERVPVREDFETVVKLLGWDKDK